MQALESHSEVSPELPLLHRIPISLRAHKGAHKQMMPIAIGVRFLAASETLVPETQPTAIHVEAIEI
jgi:hypothetical protein